MLLASPRPLRLFVLVLGTGAACTPPPPAVPLDAPLFPTGLAIAKDRLLVVSSDFNKAEEAGALLAADLAAVRSQVAADGPDDVALDAYVDAAVLPRFGDRPVVTAGAERVYVAAREVNRVVVLDIAADGTLSCPEVPADEDEAVLAGTGAPVCGASTSSVQLPVNDPYDVLITNEVRDEAPDEDELGALSRVEGVITSQSSPLVFFFSDDTRREGAARTQVTSSIELPNIFGGVQSALVRPETNGTDAVVIAALSLSRDLQLFGARLGMFFPEAGAFGADGAGEGELKTFDVTLATGSLSMRDVVLVPGDDGDDDALVAILREPDALARFEIDDVGGLPDLRLTAVGTTCKGPTALARANLGTDAAAPLHRLVVACHDGDVVEAIDPFTLRSTDAVRFAGRGPFDVVTHRGPGPDGAPGEGEIEVYVSFFLDDSIGTLRFNQANRLEQTGRIGTADPRPEDGRE